MNTADIMDAGVTVVTKPVVNVRITSTITAFEKQSRFNRGISIAELKVRLKLALLLGFARPDLPNTLTIIVKLMPSSCVFDAQYYVLTLVVLICLFCD